MTSMLFFFKVLHQEMCGIYSRSCGIEIQAAHLLHAADYEQEITVKFQITILF